MSRTVGPSVIKAMMRTAPPQRGHTGMTRAIAAAAAAHRADAGVVPGKRIDRRRALKGQRDRAA